MTLILRTPNNNNKAKERKVAMMNESEQYAQVIQRELQQVVDEVEGVSASKNSSKHLTVQYKAKHKLVTITLDRPSKLNTFTNQQYLILIKLLEYINENENISFVILTGSGKFFTAGNDLGNVGVMLKPNATSTEIEKGLDLLIFDRVQRFVDVLIDFKKIFILAVNGPAVGIGVTMIPLCDFVFCSDQATFHTPFMNLAICAEACSSYTFPKLMGQLKANSVLLQNVKMTASDAANQYHLVHQVFPHEQLMQQVESFVAKNLSMHPPGALIATKQLMREKQVLHEVNTRESQMLKERMLSREAQLAIQKFFQAKL